MDKILKYIVFALIFSGCAQKAAIVLEGYEKGALLKFNFTPGQTIKYKERTDMSITTEAKGFTQTMYSSTETKTTQTVEDTGEVILLKISFDDASGTARVNEQMKPIEEIEEIIGKSISLKLSREGKIIEAKGLKELDYFRKQEKEMSSQYEERFGFLPDKVVKQGETWDKKFENTEATYLLKSFERKDEIDCAKIEGKEKMSFTEDIDVQGMKGKIEIAGEAKGVIFFALKEGIILESKSTASIEGEQEITLNTGETMKVPVYMDVKTHRELIQ